MCSPNFRKGDDGKEPVTMGTRILGFCFAVFLSVILLSLAIQVLSAIWGWLVLIAVIIAVVWIGFVIYRRWRDGW